MSSLQCSSNSSKTLAFIHPLCSIQLKTESSSCLWQDLRMLQKISSNRVPQMSTIFDLSATHWRIEKNGRNLTIELVIINWSPMPWWPLMLRLGGCWQSLMDGWTVSRALLWPSDNTISVWRTWLKNREESLEKGLTSMFSSHLQHDFKASCQEEWSWTSWRGEDWSVWVFHSSVQLIPIIVWAGDVIKNPSLPPCTTQNNLFRHWKIFAIYLSFDFSSVLDFLFTIL